MIRKLLIFLALSSCVEVRYHQIPRSLPATQLVADFRIVGSTRTAGARVDLFIDGSFIDLVRSGSDSRFSFHRWPYGLGKHKLKVIERGKTPGILLERPFTSSCKAFDMSAKWACNDVPNYWQIRQKATKLMRDPKMQLGINASIGGTITQLYSVDRTFNLISEHPGAGIQLSMWGRLQDGSIEAGSYGKHCQKETIYDGAVNPIQASAPDCLYTGPLNDAPARSCGKRCLVSGQSKVYQYTQAKGLPDLKWDQAVKLEDGIARLTYTVNYSGNVAFDIHPQELPGVLLNLGHNPKLTWFGFNAPYKPVPEIWTEDLEDGLIHTLSVGLNAFQPVTRVMAESWYSICSGDGRHCVTIGLPASDLWRQVNVEYRRPAETVYASPLGFFSLHGFNRSWRVNISPQPYEAVRDRIAQ